MDINNEEGGTKEFQLVGPPDIIGFSKDLVIKTEPAHWSTTSAPNLLAHIEFYEEDFPWRYSPAAPNLDSLRPWISLIVLKEIEFQRKEQTVPLPQILLLDRTVLPDYQQAHLWAHVQKLIPANGSADASADDHIISRLVCPRKLEPNTGYYALVIPTFESGRIAGLGQGEADLIAINSQDSSWGKTQVDFPVYFEWFFRTGDDMDFESLATLLEARPTDPLVGRKPINCQNPAFGINDYNSDFTVYLEGALKSPESTAVVPITNDSSNNLSDFEKKLKHLLDATTNANGDPVVTPPFYGQKHIFEPSLDLQSQNWIHQLNRHPAYRSAAGLGARVLRKYQDEYLQKAWQQVENIFNANKIIDAANASLAVCQQIYDRNMVSLTPEELIAFASPVHVKIKVKNSLGKISTLQHAFETSCFNGSFYGIAFRRLVSRKGVFIRKLQSNGSVLDLEQLKKLVIAKTRSAYSLLPGTPYTTTIIKHPVFQVQAPFNFGDNQLGLSMTEVEQAINSFVKLIKVPPRINPCEEKVIDTISDTINPGASITYLLNQTLDMPEAGWFDNPLKIKEALAYPDIEDPMYEKLKEISMEYLIPNLHLITNNSVTLLQSNRKFIESYMVGLNVAMCQEMRWREYPTDERGSCFRQFWDVKGIRDLNSTAGPELTLELFKDITPIHTWKNWKNETSSTKLDEFGTHNKPRNVADEDQLVLVIRGDLLKSFPNTSIYAVSAVQDSQKKLRITAGSEIKFPVFKMETGADLKFLGFDLSIEAAYGNATDPGWFFVLQETPGETRFGLDIQEPDLTKTSFTWDDASWHQVSGKNISANDNFSVITANMSDTEKNTLGSLKWGRSSADMAYILYQKPVMIAIHAKEMLA
ncbi:MAG: hypothetical protein ACJ75B_08335 [Flavisolibacter sp.]